MKRIVSIVGVLFCGLGVLLWALQSFESTWEPRLLSLLQNRLSTTLNARVDIESLSFPFFHRISLKNISVRDKGPEGAIPFFQAKEVSLTVSLLDLPFALYHRDITEALGLISLDSPSIILSREDLARRPHPGGPSHSLWFTLAWKNGTLQWHDPNAPRGSWTLYQSKGSFRIRGPKTYLLVQGHSDEADSLKLYLTSFRHRWEAKVAIQEAHLPSLIELADHFHQSSVLPPPVSLQGDFNFEGNAHGTWPLSNRSPWTILQEAHLSFLNTYLQTKPGVPPIQLIGGITLKKGQLLFSSLSLKVKESLLQLSGTVSPLTLPPSMDLKASGRSIDYALLSQYLSKSPVSSRGLKGIGTLQLSATSSWTDPEMALTAQIHNGQLFQWPFEEGTFNVRGLKDHWQIDNTTLHIAQGQVALKGTASPATLDLQLTGQDLSMADGLATSYAEPLKGRLSFSVSSRGSLEDIHTAGSFWISNFSWGTTYTESVHGDVELTPKHFRAQATSDDSRFTFESQGHRTSEQLSLEQMDVQLRDGATLNAHGTVHLPDNTINLQFEAHHVIIPGDIPSLDIPELQGLTDLQGRLQGSLDHPTLLAEANSEAIRWGTETFTKAHAVFKATKDQLEISEFQLDPGIRGSGLLEFKQPRTWKGELTFKDAPAVVVSSLLFKKDVLTGKLSGVIAVEHRMSFRGEGHLELRDGTLAKWPLTQGHLRFELDKSTLHVRELELHDAHEIAKLNGEVTWKDKQIGKPYGKLLLTGEGSVFAIKNSLWSIPLQLHGFIDSEDHWRGEVSLRSSAVTIRGSPADPFESVLKWRPQQFEWSKLHWGTSWHSEGMIHFFPDHAIWSGQVSAHDVSLSKWQSWFFPKRTSAVQGHLDGEFKLEGQVLAPQIQFTGRVTKGLWRAFQFENTVQGLWTNEGLQPLILQGRCMSGGDFNFRGRYSLTEANLTGSLQVTDMNLVPLGESLSLPHPLRGKARGTFTVSGPVDQLHLTGHVESGPLVYGEPETHPLQFQTLVMDMTLAPSPDYPTDTSRLSLTQALAKTLEEEIRLNPGSYVEFSNGKEARFHIGTEIRNVHLGLLTLFGGGDLDGLWRINPNGITIQGDAHTRSLFMNDYELEEGLVHVTFQDGVIAFERPLDHPALITGRLDIRRAPQLKFTDFYISGKDQQGLQLSGEIGPSHWDFSLSGQKLDMGTLGSLAGFPYPLEGAANVSIRGTGDTNSPHVRGQMNVENGKVLGLHFRSGAGAFAWEGNSITFTRLLLTDPGRYTLIAAGILPLSVKKPSSLGDPRKIDFSVRLQDSNLSLLQSISSEVKLAKGSVQALLQFQGTADHPLLRGSIHVTNGDVTGAHYFRRLKNINLALGFDKDILHVQEFSGEAGEGQFKGQGTIIYTGFTPKTYDLQFDIPSSKGLEVQVPELAIPESPLAKRFRFLTSISHCDVKGHVTFRGAAEAPIFSGEAQITNGHFTFPPSTKNPAPREFVEWVRRISWDVNLIFKEGAWFENELVEANLLGNLRLKGPSDRLRVDGGLDITDGKISYLGIDFDIRQARFDLRSFEGESGTFNTPYVRGIGESHVQTVDPISGQGLDDTITLTIDYAPVNEIKPRLVSTSDPTLAQDKVLARVTQLDVKNLTPQERNYMYQQQMVRLIDTSLATPLARNLLKRTGLVDELHVSRVINPANATPADVTTPNANQQQTTTNLFAGTKYTLAKNLSNRLSLGYGLRFEQITTTELQSKLDLRSDVEMSYRMLSNVYLKGSFDLPSSTPGSLPERKVTIEPRWRFGWWGHTNPPKPKKDTASQ